MTQTAPQQLELPLPEVDDTPPSEVKTGSPRPEHPAPVKTGTYMPSEKAYIKHATREGTSVEVIAGVLNRTVKSVKLMQSKLATGAIDVELTEEQEANKQLLVEYGMDGAIAEFLVREVVSDILADVAIEFLERGCTCALTGVKLSADTHSNTGIVYHEDSHKLICRMASKVMGTAKYDTFVAFCKTVAAFSV